MIPLDDPIWDTLSCHNISGREFADILTEYYAGSIPTDKDLEEDLLQCACGPDVYDSCIAAAPHLVHLASESSPSAAAIMLSFVALAIAEVARGAYTFDTRLTTPLPEAARAGEIVARSILESPELDQKAREDLQLSLLALSGDTAGFWETIENSWTELPETVIKHEASSPKIQVNWGSDQSSSYTYNSGP